MLGGLLLASSAVDVSLVGYSAIGHIGRTSDVCLVGYYLPLF